MAVHFKFHITTKPASKDARPGRDPGWYVINHGMIVAHCDTEEEAGRVAEDFAGMSGRVNGKSDRLASALKFLGDRQWSEENGSCSECGRQPYDYQLDYDRPASGPDAIDQRTGQQRYPLKRIPFGHAPDCPLAAVLSGKS